MRQIQRIIVFFVFLISIGNICYGAEDPLPSWNESAAKSAILDFVKRATNRGNPDYVAPELRIATFDNDGTLWAEKPLYFQLQFVLDRVKELAPNHPDWKEKQPFKAALEGDMKAIKASGYEGLMTLLTATHSGMPEAEFRKIAVEWMAKTRHPRFNRPYTDLVYQPMLELLAFLRAKGFQTYIASAGGSSFMRPFTHKIYGIPEEMVIGSYVKTAFEYKDGSGKIMRLPEIAFINDKAAKPIGIYKKIGKRPLAAFGNSDGDLEMLQYASAGEGVRFGLIVHHTDGQREWAYDRNSSIGRLDKALDAAVAQGWAVVDMKLDWKVIFPFELE